MKVLGKAVLLIMTMLASTSSFAAGKYGIINMQKVILTVEEGKTARSDLEKQIKAKETELMGKKKELDKLNEDWKTQAPLLSEEAKLKKQQEFQERFVNLRNEEMNFQKEIKQKESEATQKIAIKVQQMVETMSKQKDLDAVFEVSSSGLLYLKDPMDLTDEVIKSYDNKVSKK